MEITYLLNSGFMVKEGKTLLIFDDFEDPSGSADRAVDAGDFDRLYIFASHAHFDHFGTHIRAYSKQANRYIFGNDIKRTKRVKVFPPDIITFMKKYTTWESDGIRVWAYDSTDIGVSFLVELDSGTRIFHAGDFNWWDWKEETDSNRRIAKNTFLRQLGRMEGFSADVSFFPVDDRLGESNELGVTEFVKSINTKTLIAMHRMNYPRWTPSNYFKENARELPIWSPLIPGERRIYEDGELKE